MKFLTWDLETFPNIFTAAFKDYETGTVYLYELSDRKNQRSELMQFLDWAIKNDYYFVGFNSLGFDYPIIHHIFTQPYTFTYQKASELCNQIINSGEYGLETIRLNDRKFKNIDLAKINHFDNKMRRTSLKSLQFAMRSESVEDLPFDIRHLTDEEKDVLIKYNIHDVNETENFLKKCMHLIKMRKDLLDSTVLNGDVLNFSDVKIGIEYLIKEIGKNKCFNNYKPVQTIRNSVEIKNVVLPKIYFIDEKYEEVKQWFESLTWYREKENNIKLETTIDKFTYHFGIGGIHGSVENKFYKSDDKFDIVDLDVASLYPSIGIVNKFYPEHLGEEFCTKYEGLKEKRFQQPKGTPLNAMYKLALNGAYGNSNNEYSCFYDPAYMLKITVNGQLQLLQLSERLASVPSVEIIQVNTDGITCKVPKDVRHFFNLHKQLWQDETGLELEEVEYSRMWIKDVNNYIAESKSKKIKRKGAYQFPEKDNEYDGYWNKNYSSMIVQKCLNYSMTKNIDPKLLINLFTDPYDFALMYKTPSGSKVLIGDKECTKTVRYYVSKTGQKMRKISKPKGDIGSFKRRNGLTDEYYNSTLLTIPFGAWDERIHTKNKSKYEMVETSIESGWLVKNINNINDFNINDVDFNYYLEEVNKLIIKEN